LFERINCCEETVLDDFVAATTRVSEPATLALFGIGLVAMRLGRRRARGDRQRR
jgi:hypothetical protein